MKAKIKQTMTVILALTILLCTLSACGAKPDKNILGKWYDSQGQCLDIRSDGTYKLDSDYGTGTWKYLDDGETIEFKDFYGSTIQTKTGKDDNGDYIVLESWGTYYKDTQVTETNNAEQITYSLKPGANSFYSDDRALISYKNAAGKDCAALIDVNGKVLYNSENAYPFAYYVQHCFLGIGVVCEEKSGSETYQIINKSGEIIASSDGGEFDKVLAYGDGLALVYKDNSDINGTHNCFGVIDSSGAWKQPLQEIEAPPEAKYEGCGMFQFRRTFNAIPSTNKSFLYNANTGKYTVIKGDLSNNNYIEMEFLNDIAYYYCDEDVFSINTNFETQKMDNYNEIMGGCILKQDQSHLAFYCPSANKLIELKQYHPDQLFLIETSDNYIFLCLHGKDGNDYFIVLDNKGNQLFEPVRCDDGYYYLAFSDNYIAFRKDSKYSIIDLQGNLIAEQLNYENISPFYNDIAVASIDDKYCYINSKGEKVLTALYK